MRAAAAAAPGRAAAAPGASGAPHTHLKRNSNAPARGKNAAEAAGLPREGMSLVTRDSCLFNICLIPLRVFGGPRREPRFPGLGSFAVFIHLHFYRFFLIWRLWRLVCLTYLFEIIFAHLQVFCGSIRKLRFQGLGRWPALILLIFH